MSRPPGYMNSVSEALCEVMDDIGVNETLVSKRRRNMELMETIYTISGAQLFNSKSYSFGSQIEGSTTLGLQSDFDLLFTLRDSTAIQNIREWKHGMVNMLMIQNENIAPGYCYLQGIRSDRPFPYTANDMDTTIPYALDRAGGILAMNNKLFSDMVSHRYPPQQQGPAMTARGTDIVPSCDCESSPLQATAWLKKLRCSKWPSENVKRYCRNAGCFVVPVASKGSDSPELEWRISTSLQERCLMFSLNIPQLMCYILMKMILKTYINPHVEDVLSSFMCKNVLLYCVANSSHDWHTGNVLAYLHLCLFMLKECVQKGNCPHFIIPGNNLLAGRMKEGQRGKLLDIIDNLMEIKVELLYKIKIDNLGKRLKMKLNMIPNSPELQSPAEIASEISAELTRCISESQSHHLKQIEHVEITEKPLSELSSMLKYSRAKASKGNVLEKIAYDLLIPAIISTLGSVMASTSMEIQAPISDEAFTYLEAGKESDVLSGRLKLVSVLYCTGDIERAEHELRVCQDQYNISVNEPACVCHDKEQLSTNHTSKYKEKEIKFLAVFYTRFLKSEINCVPYELRYELLSSYVIDRQMRTIEASEWNDFIITDSMPYLYFLQYKTYGHLQKRIEQQQALYDLQEGIADDPNLIHRERALNLFGQCLEQENRPTIALECYILSLKQCNRNNAARFLLCILLSKLWKRYKA